MKASDILQRVQFFSFANCRTILYVEAAHRCTEVDEWWFVQPYRGILSVPSLRCMVGSSARISWTFWDVMFIQWSRYYSPMATASSKMTMFRYIPLMWLRIGMNSLKGRQRQMLAPQSPDLNIIERQVKNKENVILRRRVWKAIADFNGRVAETYSGWSKEAL